MEEYRGWLQAVENDRTRAQWIICNVEFYARLGSINKHAASFNHENNFYMYILQNFPDDIDNFVEPIRKVHSDMASIELKTVALMLGKKLSFLFIESLVPLESQNLQEITLTRQRARSIAVNVIAPCHKVRMASILRPELFAVSIDESTSRSVQAYLC